MGSGFGLRVEGCGFRVLGFGFRVSSSVIRGQDRAVGVNIARRVRAHILRDQTAAPCGVGVRTLVDLCQGVALTTESGTRLVHGW